MAVSACFYGALGEIRTPDLMVRSHSLESALQSINTEVSLEHWTGSQNTVRTYPTSASLNRAFCGTCGSALPVVASPWMPEETEDGVYVPAGSHNYGPPPQIHIFIAHKAPWHVITGELIQHDEYPPPNNFGTVPDPQLSPAQHGGVRGGCLCSAIQFEVVEPFKIVHQCHCGRCR